MRIRLINLPSDINPHLFFGKCCFLRNTSPNVLWGLVVQGFINYAVDIILIFLSTVVTL